MSDTSPRARCAWEIFVHGRENEPGQPFARIADATDAQDALDQVKTDLNGSPRDYDRDALCPALVAVPADDAATAAPEARTTHTGDSSR